LTIYSLIKDFRLSKSLTVRAQAFRFPLRLVKTVKELGGALELRNWRDWPMIYDVPAACQIFGSIVADAAIEGILYNSGLTQKRCLAIFLQNFHNSSSYVELDDSAPSSDVPRRVDSSNFGDFV